MSNKIVFTDNYEVVPTDIKPDENSWYTLVCDGGLNISAWYDSVRGWEIPKEKYAYEHWLRPKPQSVILTRDELEKLCEEVWDGNDELSGLVDKKTFIEKLLNQKSNDKGNNSW